MRGKTAGASKAGEVIQQVTSILKCHFSKVEAKRCRQVVYERLNERITGRLIPLFERCLDQSINILDHKLARASPLGCSAIGKLIMNPMTEHYFASSKMCGS